MLFFSGTLTLVDDDKILWSVYVDHQLFSLAKLDITVSGLLALKIMLQFTENVKMFASLNFRKNHKIVEGTQALSATSRKTFQLQRSGKLIPIHELLIVNRYQFSRRAFHKIFYLPTFLRL
jgi:hypothetical protein